MRQTFRRSALKPAERDARTVVHPFAKTAMEATVVVVVLRSIMETLLLPISSLDSYLHLAMHHKAGFLHLRISRDLVGLLRHRR